MGHLLRQSRGGTTSQVIDSFFARGIGSWLGMVCSTTKPKSILLPTVPVDVSLFSDLCSSGNVPLVDHLACLCAT